MARNREIEVKTGSCGQYLWLTASDESIDSLLEACPLAVLNKYLAITSLDSGSVRLNDEEKLLGWESRNGIAYSPKIQSTEKLPHEWYDEWYVFATPPDLGKLWEGNNVFEAPLRREEVAAFVNFGGFSLHDTEMKPLADLFWMQLESICPESVILDGDFFNFVSRNRESFEAVRKAFCERRSS
jgi:hypothetical protein